MAMIYLISITFGLCLGYFIFIALLPYLFDKKIARVGKVDIASVILVGILSLSSYFLVNKINNIEISNRILHASGSFFAFLVCYLVVRNSNLNLNKLQFFIFCAMVVTTLGVGNEIVEFFLQNYFGLVAATSINDTWLDLISNTVGLLIAAVIFTPFINRKSKFILDEKARF